MKNHHALLFVAAMLLSAQSIACTCAPLGVDPESTVNEAYERYPLIFLGETVSVEYLDIDENILYIDDENVEEYEIDSGAILKFALPHGDPEYQITVFDVKDIWKGPLQSTFTTKVSIACCICGIEFAANQTYLVYASGPDEEGYYYTSACSPSGPVVAGWIKDHIPYLDKVRASAQ